MILPRRLSALERLGLILSLAAALVIGVVTLSPLPPEVQAVPGGDKLHHLVAFALLAFPAVATRPARWLPVLLLGVAYGGAIELIQPHVGRFAEWGDFAADAAGAALGTALGAWIAPRLRRGRE